MTHASKTDLACDCGWLEQSADDPDLPVRFDPTTNEFAFVWGEPPSPASLILFHCPFCGGRAPASKRETLFAAITEAERERLGSITSPIATLDDVLRVLGPPDDDFEQGESDQTPAKDGQPPEHRTYRSLRYDGLSETATVGVRVLPGGAVAFWFVGKYIGPPRG
jgi:hypothetical protein